MTYTVRISGDSPQATGIINLLKSLQKDYDFIEISSDVQYSESDLSPEWVEELDKRMDYIEKHPNEGKEWEDVKRNLLKDAK